MKKLIYILLSILMLSMFFAVSAYAEKTVYVATVEGKLDLYLSPDKDSLKIIDVPGCAQLRLIKTEGTWGNVVFANKCGWINLSYTRDSFQEAVEATGFESLKNVKTNSGINKVDLYTLPSGEEKHGSEKKYTISDNMILKITRETQDGWGLVSMGEEFLWVKLDDTEPYITATEQAISEYELYYVYAFSEDGKVYMYSDPKGRNIVDKVTDCAKLTVRKTQGNYAYVSYKGINGWIDLNNATRSLSNAQVNTGRLVNLEYNIKGDSSVEIFNIPSNKSREGAIVVGSINAGNKVFVQRRTDSGWVLINHNGQVGWIPARKTEAISNDDSKIIRPLGTYKEGYVATGKEGGLELFPLYDSNTVVARVPECVKVEIIAEKDGRQYVYSDYASGWTEPGGLTDSYEKAIDSKRIRKSISYRVKENTAVMSLPFAEYLCGNQRIGVVDKNEKLSVIRVVTTGKVKWGLIEINGVKGWVNLTKTSRIFTPLEITLFILGGIACLAVIVFAVIFIVRKIKKIRKIKKDKKKDKKSAKEDEIVSTEKGEKTSEEESEKTEELIETE